MRWTIVVAAAGLLLTACGGSSSDEPGRNENLAATTSRSPLRVSEEAACDLFFETDDAPGPRANAIIMTAAEDPTLSDIDSSQVHEVIEDLDLLPGIGNRSSPRCRVRCERSRTP